MAIYTKRIRSRPESVVLSVVFSVVLSVGIGKVKLVTLASKNIRIQTQITILTYIPNVTYIEIHYEP